MRTIPWICILVAISITGTEAIWRSVNKCGLSNYADAGEGLSLLRIVGGEAARPNEFPYQIALWSRMYNVVYCSGVLINFRWFLTAAHCLDIEGISTVDEFNAFYEIRIGDFDTTVIDTKEKIRKADKVFIHEDYQVGALYENDIALVRMNRLVGNAQGRIRPICRPDAEEDFVGETAIASGWGRLGRTEPQPLVLQYAPLIVLSHAECSTYAPPEILAPSMVCTSDGRTNTERDICFADSGGPLAVKEDGRFHLVGIVSLGTCAGGLPSIFTRVTSFLDWIDTKL